MRSCESGGDLRGGLQPRTVGIRVLRVVVVERVAAGRDDLAGEERAGPGVADHGALDLPGIDAALEQRPAVVAQRIGERGLQAGWSSTREAPSEEPAAQGFTNSG